jgi:hypothetical protein
MKVVGKRRISGDEVKFTRTAAAGGAPTEITARRAK